MKSLFGILPTGEEIYKFTLQNTDAALEVISYGATITSFRPFGTEIIGGFDTLEDYLASRSYHGATVGRVCNRIIGATFTMNGRVYNLTKNNGEHCLHGGSDGYHNKPWRVLDHGEDYVKLGYTSKDGQSGFPSRLDIEASFRLAGTSLEVSYSAVPDGMTPIMITTHGFFNLTGYQDSVEAHRVWLMGDEYTEVNESRLPTGKHLPIEGSFLDLRRGEQIGEKIGESPIGYDHNILVRRENPIDTEYGELYEAATVEGGALRMRAYTNQPGFQFYVLNKPSETAPRLHGGIKQFYRSAFCIEPQVEPNCVNHGLAFYYAGEEYDSTIIYKIERI